MECVWIVLAGECGEGGCVVGVYGRKPSEKRVVSLSTPHGGSWVRVKSEKGSSRWQSGRDFLLLEKHEVK